MSVCNEQQFQFFINDLHENLRIMFDASYLNISWISSISENFKVIVLRLYFEDQHAVIAKKKFLWPEQTLPKEVSLGISVIWSILHALINLNLLIKNSLFCPSETEF